MITRGWASAVAALALMLAGAGPAVAASSFNRNCATPSSGFVVGPENADYEYPWVVNGPWHIRMAPGPAYRLAREEGPLEFGYRLSPTRDAPCWIAQSVAVSASRAWWHWHGNDGFANVHTTGMGRSLYVGLFHCAGIGLSPPRVVKLTCHNRPATIWASFTISDNPYA